MVTHGSCTTKNIRKNCNCKKAVQCLNEIPSTNQLRRGNIAAHQRLGKRYTRRRELEAWTRGEAIDPKLLRDHIAKLNEVDEHSYVLRVIVGPSGIPAKEVYYRDGKSLKRLRELCVYGDDAETNDIGKLFSRGWHTDSFARGLKQKIDWLELWLPLYEQA